MILPFFNFPLLTIFEIQCFFPWCTMYPCSAVQSLILCPCVYVQCCQPGCLTAHGACEISPVYNCSCCCWCLSLHFSQSHFMYTCRPQHCFFACNNNEYFYGLIAKSEAVAIGNPALSTVNRGREATNKKNG